MNLTPIDKIKPYTNNPRNIPEAALNAVANSIKEFGFRSPIITDRNGVIICGHTRFLAAHKLGLDSVPVICADDLTPEQVKAYRIADNKTGELAKWERSLLAEELADIKDDFDFTEYGFSDDELAKILKDEIEDGQTDPDAIPATPYETETQTGDLFLLGDHRLLCGDATKPEDVARLMDGEKAELYLTDPPYGVKYEGKTEDKLTIQNDDIIEEHALTEFLKDSFKNAFDNTTDNAVFYVWHAGLQMPAFLNSLRSCGFYISAVITWIKTAITLSWSDYKWKHEPCLYGFKQGGGGHFWKGALNEATVWDDIQNINDLKKEDLIRILNQLCREEETTVWSFAKPTRSADHPTIKPVDLFIRSIRNSSRRGDTVLDTFAGSGTNAIACEQTGRNARLIEISPQYCDVIVKRWEDFTGKQAERIRE